MHHKRSKMKPEEDLPSPGAVSVQVKIAYIINNVHICIQFPAASEPFFGYLTKLSSFRQILQYHTTNWFVIPEFTSLFFLRDFSTRMRSPYNSWSPAKRAATIGMLTSCGLDLFTCICSFLCVSFPPCSYQFPRPDHPLISGTLGGNCFCFGLIKNVSGCGK